MKEILTLGESTDALKTLLQPAMERHPELMYEAKAAIESEIPKVLRKPEGPFAAIESVTV